MRYRSAIVAALILLSAGCTEDAPRRPAPASGGPPVVASTRAPADDEPANQLRGAALTGPTGLRLLVEGEWFDADTGTRQAVAAGIQTWLRPASGPPILLVDPPPVATRRPGPLTVTRLGAGTPAVLRLTTSADRYGLGPSADGQGVWVSEYRSRTRCTLREQGLDGRTRRAARPVACGVEPVLETPAGLWVSKWLNVYSRTSPEVHFNDPSYALLDPRTLHEKASYEEAIVIGAHHVLTMTDEQRDLVLRDTRTGSAIPLTKPADHNLHVFNAEFPVGRVSPDGRYALFRLGSHHTMPQVIDLWLLDLTSGTWTHVPGLPVHGSLKYASETWAPDGRVVMLGEYGVDKRFLATWRPGDAQVLVRPDTLPERLYDSGLGSVLAVTGQL